tara:strand:- start:4604 stop:4765 length:162 start_codon:yes stop_codon:yes gene_type:complete
MKNFTALFSCPVQANLIPETPPVRAGAWHFVSKIAATPLIMVDLTTGLNGQCR